jgi:starch synthase
VKRILMLAAENGAISGAKVGGMADVIRDLPSALLAQGVVLDVIMPSYGFLADSVNASKLAEFQVMFAGRVRHVELLRAPHPEVSGALIYFIELSDEKSGLKKQQIYSQGSADRPFAEDADKFALFCLCVATALKDQLLPMPYLVHLHDWHSAMFAMLSRFDKQFSALESLPCVYTIHNLAIQGIRPLREESSSLSAWFPKLLEQLSDEQLKLIIDPRYPHCINPMRVGINLSNTVHLVSPTYAEEVLKPSNHDAGFFGGEGLEDDLKVKRDSGCLLGILNGCVYDDLLPAVNEVVENKSDNWLNLLSKMELALLKWQADKPWVASGDLIALTRIAGLWRQSYHAINSPSVPSMLITSVGRLTDQKVLILRQKIMAKNGQSITVLESILQSLAQQQPDGLFILLGSGDVCIADEFKAVAAKHTNFVFLNGYDEAVSQALYDRGDLFLMPSSFEPCGISQMLSMKAGQICLVNGVGGLKDTVVDNKTGYLFTGETLVGQAENVLARFSDALVDFKGDKWNSMQRLASQQRFDWPSSAVEYKRQLYCLD